MLPIDASVIDLCAVAHLDRYAALDVDLLLQGETGTGKDTVALDIHRRYCPDGPFVSINCAAIPEALMEGELFGVEAGAYTGAVKSRHGKIEAAHGGILYLDEIDSMPMSLQAKLLHPIQYRGSVRLGGHEFRHSQFRLIASTKVDLKNLAQQGQFRMDLYYRLSTLILHLPALRGTGRALPVFLRMVDAVSRLAPGTCSEPPAEHLQAQLLAHDWPGNYRELLSCAVRYANGVPLFEPGDFPASALGSPGPHAAASPSETAPTAAAACETAAAAQDHETPPPGSDGPLRQQLRAFESKIILSAIHRCHGNLRRAAAVLGLTPQTLHYRLNLLGLRNDAGLQGNAMRPAAKL